jgi:beta-glucosidase
VLDAARAAGIEPWVCLHHFVLPRWTGPAGFRDWPRLRDRWRRHVEFVAETFGDQVAGWKPINEPSAYAFAGFLQDRHPPGGRDLAATMEALEGIHLAKYEAASILRQAGRPVATIHAVVPMFAGDDTSESRARLELFDGAVWGCWMGALRDGVLRVPTRAAIEVQDYPAVFDLVGFSYYLSATVTAGTALGPYPTGRPVGPMGYVPWSGGLGLALDRLAAELPGRPLLISEHGVGTHDDAFRCEVLRESLDLVARRIAAGMDVRGFFHWTGVDNYEWSRGFSVPFGIFDRHRRPKPSAELLRTFTASRTAAGRG